MSQPPAPYDRSYSFTDFSESNPTTPHQGQKIDQELNNVRTSLNATISRLGEIQADDGKVRTTALNLPVIAEEVEPLLTDAPVQAVEAAGAQQIGLVNDAGDAKIADMLAILSSQNAVDALAAKDAAVAAADVAESSAVLASGYAGTAQSYATSALQSKNSAAVHAQVAIDAAASIPLIVGPAGPQGIQGVPGVAGTDGTVWVYRGAYDNGVVYAANDFVTLNGSSYVMINFIGAAGYDPIGYPASWQLVASKGEQGAAGAAGQQGIQGIPGVAGPQGLQGLQGIQGPAGPAGSSLLSITSQSDTFTVNSSSHNYFINFSKDDGNNALVYMDNATAGTQVKFRQGGNSQMIFSPASAFYNKTASAGPNAIVNAVFDGATWHLSGDLNYVPSGFVYSSSCVYAEGYDAAGTFHTGNWTSEAIVADGSGGTTTSYNANANGCWYPSGYVTYISSSYSAYTVYWTVYDSSYNSVASGDATYTYQYDAEVADGNGSSNYNSGLTWQAQSGYMFTSGQYYDSNYSSYYNYEVYSDGSMGYYVNTYQAY